MAEPGKPAPRYREVTISSIMFGLVVGAIMNAAITYAGLKIGFTIVGSAIAAVLGFGVLRGLLRRGSILEVNIGQTIASAVNTPNSGVIFTVPVLLLLGFTLDVGSADFWLVTMACVAGAVLGGAFIVPLRKQMIDIERLRFPSATAVGAILKSPGAGSAKAIVLVVGILVGVLIAMPAQLPGISTNAAVDDLDTLVESGRISRADKLLTEQIDGWVEAGAAPESVMTHGRLLLDRDAAILAGENHDELDTEITIAAVSGYAEVRNAAAAHATDAARLKSYPDDLARLVAGAVTGEGDWEALRSKEAGWAQDPLLGYADLGWRMPAETMEGEASADFAYDGLGDADDPVLTERVDRDRDGRPDLILTDSAFNAGRLFGLPDEMELLFAIAPFALGAGYLTGRAGLFVLAGGVLAYVVINPVMHNMGWTPPTLADHQVPGWGYGNVNRPLGVGLLLGGAMMGVIASLPAIREAIRAIASSGASKVGGGGRDELGLRVLLVAAMGGVIALAVAADVVGNEPINTTCPVTEAQVDRSVTTSHNGYTVAFASDDAKQTFEAAAPEQQQNFAATINADKGGWLSGLDPHLRAILIALVGTGWIWFAGIIIAQCTGMTDWSPISGMALLTVVLVMLLGGSGAVLSAVLLGAALCVAITCAADMMADLKTGYIVGAVPKRQQVVELVFTGIGPLITMSVLVLIAASNEAKFGVPIGPGTDTVAPQAQALEAIITGVQGGDMRYAMYGFGAAIGALLGLGAFSGLGVLVGLSMYLPMLYISTYGIGCVVQMIVSKVKGAAWAESWGVPLAAGLIVGDALLSLGVNLWVLVAG
ncbi:MAG: OPT/YSL family transporter [Planctomycetota bacterium]